MHKAPQELRTFFVTSVTHDRKRLFQVERYALLLVDILKQDRAKGRYSVHAYVVMPDHIHVLLTPAEDVSLEKAMQFIKGGFSFRAKKEFAYAGEIWQRSYTEHRITDAADFEQHRQYIEDNPVRAGLVLNAADYVYSSAHAEAAVDAEPPRLKPRRNSAANSPA